MMGWNAGNRKRVQVDVIAKNSTASGENFFP
jgi:hypothetical protein